MQVHYSVLITISLAGEEASNAGSGRVLIWSSISAMLVACRLPRVAAVSLFSTWSPLQLIRENHKGDLEEFAKCFVINEN